VVSQEYYMKAIIIPLTLAVVSTPALARNADHHGHVRHHHRQAAVHHYPHLAFHHRRRVFVADGWQPSEGGMGFSGFNAPARAPGFARQAAPGQGAYASMVARHAAANGIPASLVNRVIMRESRYNPRAISKGNYGIMQIRLGTARAMGYTGSAAGLLDPETNMTYAVKYLAGAYKAAGGSESGAVANYARGYYAQARRRGMSPYEAPGYGTFGMQGSDAFAMQSPTGRGRAGRIRPVRWQSETSPWMRSAAVF
jgi:hypothetical protein